MPVLLQVRSSLLAVALASSLPVAAVLAEPPPATKPAAPTVVAPALSAAECAVWERERSFAATVAAHDAIAFAEHVHAQAAFDAGSAQPIHGRAAVVAAWKDIIAGTSIKLRWSPGVVTLGGDGSLAISRGPAWIEDSRPGATSRHRVGEFISTWIRDRDGQWRVLFDGGAAPMRPATAADVAKLIASIPAQCPRG